MDNFNSFAYLQKAVVLLFIPNNRNRMANSVDPDELACYEPSHLNLHYLRICCIHSNKRPSLISAPSHFLWKKMAKSHMKWPHQRCKISLKLTRPYGLNFLFRYKQ